MKPIFFTIIVGFGLMTGLEMARAQSEQIPVPKAPYLTPVPDYGHWKVTFKYKQAAPNGTASPATGAAPTPSSADDGYPAAIETIKTGDLRGVTLTFANGTSKEFTCQGDWVLNSSSQGAQLQIVSPPAIPYPYYTKGFIFLDGARVDLSTFKKAEMHNGVMAFHYKSGDTDVWIAPETMLPLAAKKEGVEGTYAFLTPPPRPFPIPKDQESLLQKSEQAYKATSSMR